MQPTMIYGGKHTDGRGAVTYCNAFDLKKVRRSYLISNATQETIRGWQGHLIESRWFMVAVGSFTIYTAPCNQQAVKTDETVMYNLDGQQGDVLFVPPGYATCIQAGTLINQLMVFSDYVLDGVDDDLRFPISAELSRYE